MAKDSSKQKKKDKSRQKKVDLSYVTEEEMRNGFKPADYIPEGVIICSFCSASNTVEDKICFNCNKKLQNDY